MAITDKPLDRDCMTEEVMEVLKNYLQSQPTATKFSSYGDGQNESKSSSGKVYTAEEFYGMMFEAGIPLEFENRNFDRLLTILRIMGSKNSTPKKMSKEEIYKQNRELNAKRRQQLKSKG